MYHRRIRTANCVVGDQPKVAEHVVKNCECGWIDFEWYVAPILLTYFLFR